MAKHRELARELYAASLGRASASRIWRSVVFAGAMLAAPIGCGGSKKPATTTASQPATSDQADRDREAADKEEAARAAADKAAAEQAAAAAEAEQQKAKEEAEKAAAEEQKAKEEADKAAAEEAAKKKRPRGGDSRPKGRGFVLA
jgi:hypothetical protein